MALDLESIGNTAGVYLIWHGGQQGRWVRVGSGTIKQRLSDHRNNPEILAYQSHGLLVTWATVPANQQEGVEAFLAEQCNPLVGERFPDRTPIPVNLPQ
jgi:hypothetical protein